jgi:hypothetical protein
MIVIAPLTKKNHSIDDDLSILELLKTEQYIGDIASYAVELTRVANVELAPYFARADRAKERLPPEVWRLHQMIEHSLPFGSLIGISLYDCISTELMSKRTFSPARTSSSKKLSDLPAWQIPGRQVNSKGILAYEILESVDAVIYTSLATASHSTLQIAGMVQSSASSYCQDDIELTLGTRGVVKWVNESVTIGRDDNSFIHRPSSTPCVLVCRYSAPVSFPEDLPVRGRFTLEPDIDDGTVNRVFVEVSVNLEERAKRHLDQVTVSIPFQHSL